jgi:radical SAM superfamily enzyme YgiQ (UPF0313 family)
MYAENINNVKTNKEILLNCVSPCDNVSPSPAMSILKAYLLNQNKTYNVKVVYWNIILFRLENEFIWDKKILLKKDMANSTIIYAAYLAVQTNNQSLYNEVKAILQSFLPIMLNERNFFDNHIEEYTTKLDREIDNYLDSINFNNVMYFGFSMKMYQWVFSSIIAEKIKKRYPNIPIVIGGINTAKEAKAFLDNFKQFDIAIWGEGEVPLSELTKFLSNNNDFSEYNIERSFFRKDNIVKASSNKKHRFYDLSTKEIFPNFDDFYYFLKKHNIKLDEILVIEGGRGCHWNRCHFCYLNEGYRYRQKSVDKISQEIRYMISKYGVFLFEFLDNDIIGKDINKFNTLLNELIKIKKEYPKFLIIGAEIITLGLSSKIIKKMFKAGILLLQIGYESASNNLLKKIDKKNTFANNLNTIKHCLDVGIIVSGANILCNLLEEQDEDILESIENLRFFRFILFNNQGKFSHHLSTLAINSSSKYYNAAFEMKQKYVPHLPLHSKAFINSFEEEEWTFFDFISCQRDIKWDYFAFIQNHYQKNDYKYKFIRKHDKILYIEEFNKEKIENIEFNYNDVSIHILYHCYDKVVSIQELFDILLKKDIYCKIEMLKEKLDFLFFKGLVYRTPYYNEIVSVVKLNTYYLSKNSKKLKNKMLM